MSFLILVRHGQSTWNLEKRFTGWVDVDLTIKGKSEAEKAGLLIKKRGIKIKYIITTEIKIMLLRILILEKQSWTQLKKYIKIKNPI